MSGPALAPRVPGRLLLTMELGEAPEHIPSLSQCRSLGLAQAENIDGGPIDRLLRHYGEIARVTRLHAPRARPSAAERVAGKSRYDDREQLSGVARVLRVKVRNDSRLPHLVDALAQLRQVQSVTPDYICRTPMDFGAGPSDRTAAADIEGWQPREQIRLPEALGYEPGDPAVVIGLADTGTAHAHPELSRRLRTGFGTVALDAATTAGLTLVGNDDTPGEDPEDEVGHGSGCAGIMVALGLTIPPGASGACGLVPARVLGCALSGPNKRVGIGALSNIDSGMKRLVDLGVKVINMSFGTPESALTANDPRPHTEVVRYALSHGLLLVAASGNSGIAERYYPAAHEGVIAVGAVDPQNNPCRFTTRGDHVAICAPGQGIRTCGIDGYQEASGTSFASPFVAAICGLLAARADRRAWPLTPECARQILMASARPFGKSGVTGSGAGVLDALAALQALDAQIDQELAAEPLTLVI